MKIHNSTISKLVNQIHGLKLELVTRFMDPKHNLIELNHTHGAAKLFFQQTNIIYTQSMKQKE